MMLDGVTLMVLVAATHRLQQMWFKDAILRWPRTWMQARGGWIAFGASCQLCVSVWSGALVLGAWWVAWPLVVVLALSALSLLYDLMLWRLGRVGTHIEEPPR